MIVWEWKAFRSLLEKVVDKSSGSRPIEALKKADYVNLSSEFEAALRDTEYPVPAWQTFRDYRYQYLGKAPYVNKQPKEEYLDSCCAFVGEKGWYYFKQEFYSEDDQQQSPLTGHITKIQPGIDEPIIEYLQGLSAQSKIGFHEDEDIEYQLTLGKWFAAHKYDDFRSCEEGRVERKNYHQDIYLDIHEERGLLPVKEMLQMHFLQGEERKNFYSFTFIVSDFGKGKSVFMNQLAFSYAQTLLRSNERRSMVFPVYINLRLASNCLSKATGVVDTYLKRHHGFGVKDLCIFSSVVFLLDSFDEISSVLTTPELIEDILPILEQRMGNTQFRIVIASRPIKTLYWALDDEQLNPYINENNILGETPEFIHIFGFTENQVNRFFNSVGIDQKGNLYQTLLRKGIMSASELRRPLLNYLLYKVMRQNGRLEELSRLSIFLSFINLLTIEAKYIGDRNTRLSGSSAQSVPRHSFEQQAIFRSILHGMAILWLMNRSDIKQHQEQNSPVRVELNKKNLFRLLYPNSGTKSTLEQNTTMVEYLSHSYLGEEKERFYFKHQSFAEVLLGEYYLKVLLQFVFEGKKVFELDHSFALGTPTAISISFFKDLLLLLRLSAGDSEDPQVIRVRQQLAPLITSMCIDKAQYTYSEKLTKVWATPENQATFKASKGQLPEKALKNWPVTAREIEAMITLCEERVNQQRLVSYDTLSVKETAVHTLVYLKNDLAGTLGQDHLWLLIVAGNALYNDIEKRIFFAGMLDPDLVFNLIKMARFGSDDKLELYGEGLFMGLDLRKSQRDFRDRFAHYDLSGLDFSYTYFEDFCGEMVNFSGCRFHHCTFSGFEVYGCDFTKASFDNIKIIMPEGADHGYSGVDIHEANYIATNMPFPGLLISLIKSDDIWNENNLYRKPVTPTFLSEDLFEICLDELEALWLWVFQNRSLSLKEFIEGFRLAPSARISEAEMNEQLIRLYEKMKEKTKTD